MGTEYHYGNTKSLEFITLGKSSVRNASLWTDLHYDLINGEIDTSLIETYLVEKYPKYEGDSKDYVPWIAKNITMFVENTGIKNLICKADEIITMPNGEIKLEHEIEPLPPFWSGDTIGGEPNPWKCIWNRYINSNDEMNTKNLHNKE